LAIVAVAAVQFGAAPGPALAASAKPATVESVCPAATPGTAQCLAIRRTDVVSAAAGALSPQSTPSGFGAGDLESAYSLTSSAASDGGGMTVAIVDAFDLPTAESDLAAYRSQFGLSACTTANGCFRKVDQNGGTSYPAANSDWGQEIALDIDMVSAICPNCHILLVEAKTPNYIDLGLAVNRAVAMGADAVSNSYIGSEWPEQTMYDTYYDHPGVVITAASGDCGYDCVGLYGSLLNEYQSAAYPASAPGVISVGGTSLVKDSSSRGWSESAWGNSKGGTGSGCSTVEPKPAWQTTTACGAYRAETDVSAVADPLTGVSVVYNGVWDVYGGTSAATPIIAATFALAGPLSPTEQPAKVLYDNAADLNDVVGGDNDVTYHTCTQDVLCKGVAGYDGPTGLGTPNGIRAFSPNASTFNPITPVRLLDTRTGNGSSGKIAANTPRTFQIGGRSVIPADATAVTGNLTVTGETNSWAVYLGPDPVAYPASSTINFKKGDIVANGVTVALSATGSLSATYMASSGNKTDLVFDVTGYFMANTAGQTYHPITPARIVDSRKSQGLAHKLTANTPATFMVRGYGEVPDDATAVTGNVTVVNSTNSWAVYLGPTPVAKPTSSTLNFAKGQVQANNLTVALSATGTLSATYMSSGRNTTDLVFDVTGFYTADLTGSAYVPITPIRLLDSRYGNGVSSKLVANQPATLQVGGRATIPLTATAISGNLTVTNETSSWAIFVGPDAVAYPTSSTLNFVKGDVKANGLTVSLSGGGGIYATYMSNRGNTTQLVLDVTGYFRGP
jgi:subtilase family serine protease